MTDKDLLRSDRAALVAALQEAGAMKFRGNACCCPFHQDLHPSAGIFNKDGVWRFKCQACGEAGDVFDIRAKVAGTVPADELRKVSGEKSQRRPAQTRRSSNPTFASMDAVREHLTRTVGAIEAEYVFTDANGEYVQTEFRLIPKDKAKDKECRPVHLTDAGYVVKAAEKPWPLYRLPEIAGAETVIIVEGGKCADCLTRYGFAVTTSMSGAKNAKSTDWGPLAGRHVIIWPDHDVDGRHYLADVEALLEQLHPAPRISVLDPASLDLAEKEDVADLVAQLKVLGKTDAEITTAIAEALKKAKPRSMAGEVRQRIADIKAGRYAAIPWVWPLLSVLTMALLPGTVTLLAGSGGATKSFMVLQAFVYWLSLGLRVALFECEQDRTFHLTRALAQECECAGLTDPNWVKDNAAFADEIADKHSTFLDNVGRILHARADAEVTLRDLAQWVGDQGKRGSRIIGVDPVTAAARLGDPWVADAKLLQSVKRTATDYGVSILLVTHPVKSVTYPDMTQLAGSAAYQRFCQTILWLEMHDPKMSEIKTSCGTTEVEHNRTLYILKARNGKGGGFKLAFQFEPENLKLSELGAIRPKKKGGSS